MLRLHGIQYPCFETSEQNYIYPLLFFLLLLLIVAYVSVCLRFVRLSLSYPSPFVSRLYAIRYPHFNRFFTHCFRYSRHIFTCFFPSLLYLLLSPSCLCRGVLAVTIFYAFVKPRLSRHSPSVTRQPSPLFTPDQTLSSLYNPSAHVTPRRTCHTRSLVTPFTAVTPSPSAPSCPFPSAPSMPPCRLVAPLTPILPFPVTLLTWLSHLISPVTPFFPRGLPSCLARLCNKLQFTDKKEREKDLEREGERPRGKEVREESYIFSQIGFMTDK